MLIKHLLILSVLALPVALSAAEDQTPVAASSTAAKEAPEISLADLKAAIDAKKVTLVDANGSESYKAGHLPGAYDGSADFEKSLPADKSALIVAYCGGPQCGAWKVAAAKATAMGYTNVMHFKGGKSGWKEAGEKFE